MRWTHVAAGLLVGPPLLVLLASCLTPQYVDTATPEDARFDVECMGGCGPRAHDLGVMVDITFTAKGRPYSRQYGVCCQYVAELRAHLGTIRDLFCDGLDVTGKEIGGLVVSTTISDATGKRGAIIDDGEGYTAFNCGEWLDQLIVKTGKTDCCRKK